MRRPGYLGDLGDTWFGDLGRQDKSRGLGAFGKGTYRPSQESGRAKSPPPPSARRRFSKGGQQSPPPPSARRRFSKGSRA